MQSCNLISLPNLPSSSIYRLLSQQLTNVQINPIESSINLLNKHQPQ